MNNLNSILVEGNLVRDPEFGHTSKGTPFCNFSIATNRYYKIEDRYLDEVSFFDVKTWSKLAELCEKHLKKGKGVRVIGRLKQDRWKDNDGRGRSRIYIIADHMEFGFSPRKKEEQPQKREEELKTAVSF